MIENSRRRRSLVERKEENEAASRRDGTFFSLAVLESMLV